MTDDVEPMLAAEVARAWRASDLPQTQFAMQLLALATGYAEAPEQEVAAALSNP